MYCYELISSKIWTFNDAVNLSNIRNHAIYRSFLLGVFVGLGDSSLSRSGFRAPRDSWRDRGIVKLKQTKNGGKILRKMAGHVYAEKETTQMYLCKHGECQISVWCQTKHLRKWDWNAKCYWRLLKGRAGINRLSISLSSFKKCP